MSVKRVVVLALRRRLDAMRYLPLLVLALVPLACQTQEPAPTQPMATARPVASFGAPLSAAPVVALGDLVKAPGTYKGKSVIASGTVARVCQERGCWLALKDGESDAVVRMHEHSFFVPTTSAGKHARVQGVVMLVKDGHECDEMEAEHAQLELDATGVELD
jgi:hypothetical protein